MLAIDQIARRIQDAVPGVRVEVIPNDTPAAQASLLISTEHALSVANFVKTDPEFQFDYASSVTGIDWLDTVIKTKTKVKKVVDGVEKEVEETTETKRPGYLEVVYHLYSMRLKQGPLIIRQRTGNRADQNRVVSLTPVWRGCEFQEREVYDLYGVILDGHPDLRRILMWDGFQHYPMRKDYVAPDDFEYEPTPHDEVHTRAKEHYPK